MTDTIAGYMMKGGVLADWRGNPMGAYRIVSSWRTPKSYVSDRMYQLEATVEGIVYTGRSAGENMSFFGKRKVKQP
jgi:hypothetical protein